MQNEKDPQMWELAKRRASFKYHLVAYIVFNAFFWIIWTFAKDQHREHNGLPWPVWPMMGWGIGLIFHYLGAFVFSKEDAAEKEYEKLMQNKNK